MRRALSLIAVLPALTVLPLAGAAATAPTALAAGETTPTQLYWSEGTSPTQAVIHTRSATGSEGSYLQGGFHPQISPNGKGLVYEVPGSEGSPFNAASLHTINTDLGPSSDVTAFTAAGGAAPQQIYGYDIQDGDLIDVTPPDQTPGDGTLAVRPRAEDAPRNPGSIIFDLEASATASCQLYAINADASDPTPGYYDDPACAVNPAWGGSNAIGRTDSAYAAPQDRSQVLEQGYHVNNTPGNSRQTYPNTAQVASPSQGLVPDSNSENGTPLNRAVYTTVVKTNDPTFTAAAPGSHAVRYINDIYTANTNEGLGGGAFFDATNQIDAWHFASDGNSVISAASYNGVNGIWRLSTTDGNREPELLDGVTAKNAQWVSRPTPSAVLISSSFPTSIPDTAGTLDFTTSIDNTSLINESLTSATLNVDLQVPAGVKASDVALSLGSTSIPLTLAGGHLTGSTAIGDIAPKAVSDLAMHVKVARTVAAGSWIATFGVTAARTSLNPGVRAHAAPTLLANAFIPSAVQGGIVTATAITATPTTGTTTTPVAVSARVTVPGAEGTAFPTGGTVQFAVDGVALGAPAAISAQGVATAPTQTYAVGTHTFYALYLGYDPGAAGGSGYQPSLSGPATATISAPPGPAKPNAPFITGIAPKPGKLLPAWLAPTSGAPVTGYTITCTRIKGLQVVTASTTATVRTNTFSGLLNNADYNCSVVAHSAVGDSPTSNVVKARPGKLPAVTLSVVKKAAKGSTITLTGTATAAGQPMTDRTITLSFRKSTGSTRTDIDTTKTDKKGHFTFSETFTGSGAYQATMVLGASTTRDKEKFVRAK